LIQYELYAGNIKRLYELRRYQTSSTVNSTLYNQYGTTLKYSNFDPVNIISAMAGGNPETFCFYVLYTAADVMVEVNGLGKIGQNFYGFHTYDYPPNDPTKQWFYSVVGKPSTASILSSYQNPNIDRSPNGNPHVDFVIMILAHEIAEMYTNPDTTGGYGLNREGSLFEIADQCAGINLNTATYCSGTQTLASNTSCTSGTFIANTLIGGKLYLLPSIFSLTSQQCLNAPLVPVTTNCAAVSSNQQVLCGDMAMSKNANDCNAIGCCGGATGYKSCYHGNTTSVLPSTGPFFPHANRIDCGYTNSSSCTTNGCCWHNSAVGSIAGTSCYRCDVFKAPSFLSSDMIFPFIPWADRVSGGEPIRSNCNIGQSNQAWMPTPGDTQSMCYLNTYSDTGVGYTYKSNPSGSLVTCSGITAQTDTLLTAFTTPESCLFAGKCWQPIFGSTIRTEQSLSVNASQTMGCFSGVAGTSIGQKLIPAPNLIPADRIFYLTDETGRSLTRDNDQVWIAWGYVDPTLLMTTSPWYPGEGRQLKNGYLYLISNYSLISSSVPAWPVDWPFVFFNDLITEKRFGVKLNDDLKGFSLKIGSLISPALNNDCSDGANPFLPLLLPSGKMVLATKNSFGALCYFTYDHTINTTTCATSIPFATKWTINYIPQTIVLKTINWAAGFCVDQSGLSTATGLVMKTQLCNGGLSQRFTLNKLGYIKTVNGGLCLTVRGGNGGSGSLIEQQTCNGLANQKWLYNAYLNTFSPSFNKTLCIDVAAAAPANNVNLMLYTCSPSTPLKFSLV